MITGKFVALALSAVLVATLNDVRLEERIVVSRGGEPLLGRGNRVQADVRRIGAPADSPVSVKVAIHLREVAALSMGKCHDTRQDDSAVPRRDSGRPDQFALMPAPTWGWTGGESAQSVALPVLGDRDGIGGSFVSN